MSPAICRHALDVGGRRVHYRRAGQGPPVLLLHESPRSSRALLKLMSLAPAGLAVLALDTPGSGLSEPLSQTAPQAEDYADALAATLQALGIARAAVYGTHSGAAFATALAQRHPQRVACLVLDGVSAFTADEQARWLAPYLPPFRPLADGSHMAWLWSRVRDQALFFPWHERSTATRLWRPLPEPDALHAVALDLLSAGDAYRAPYRAAFRFQPGPALQVLQMRAHVAAREGDVLHAHLRRLPSLPAQVRIEALPTERQAWGATLWRWLGDGAAGLAAAPPSTDPPLPADRAADTWVGAPGRRLRLRGCSAGGGRPLVWLHPSPGGARSLDSLWAHEIGRRPVFVPDLPGHGESDAGVATLDEAATAVHEVLSALDLRDAEWRGLGLGAALAQRVAVRWPGASLGPCGRPPAPGAVAPSGFSPTAEGAHLAAAWLHARDEATLGPWWCRYRDERFDFGPALDLDSIQAHAVAALQEAPVAAALRAAWLADLDTVRD